MPIVGRASILGWRTSLVASVLISVILLSAGFLVLLRLPSYNPYTFEEDFSRPLDPDTWETIGTGTMTIGGDGLTLQSHTGETYALRRYLWAQPRWEAPGETRLVGSVNLKFRFNGYSNNASAYVILETDAIRLGLSGSSVLVDAKLWSSGGIHRVAAFEVGRWYSIEIIDGIDKIEVKLNGSTVWNWTGIWRLTWVATGNLEPVAFGSEVGGSVTIAKLTCLCQPAAGSGPPSPVGQLDVLKHDNERRTRDNWSVFLLIVRDSGDSFEIYKS